MTNESPGLIRPIDAAMFLRFAADCARCSTEQHFEAIVRDHVRPMLPHGLLAAVIGRIDLEHLRIIRFIGIDCPQAMRVALPPTLNLRERPVFERWLRSRQPLVLDLPDDAPLTSARERFEIEAFGLGRLAINGVLDLASRSGSYLSFGRVPKDMPRDDILERLRLITPPLHQALLAAHRCEEAAASHPEGVLSATERDLLTWVAAGRSNAEIAQLRNRSLSTVRNQLSKAFAKLGVAGRIDAVRALGDLDGPGWR